MVTPRIEVTRKSMSAKLVGEQIAQIAKSDVLVGIPQQTNGRRGDPIGNAALMYVFSNGSPARNQPARPVIQPAIAADGTRQVIARELKDAARYTLNHKPSEAFNALQRAGIAGMNASKAWFTDRRNNWAPNAASTIRRKKSDVPGIDTGALRRSLTYVVRQTTP